MNLWDPLSRHLTAFQLHLIEQVSDAAGRLEMPIYIVGGVVRDLLLDRPIKDLDIVVEGDAIRLGREVVSLYQGRLVTHPQFFTANWESEEDPDPNIPIEGWGSRMSLDLISARSEIYPSPAVLPEVRMGSIENDLQRRDFTLNTLAVRLDGVHRGELLDRCGGLRDLQDGILRTLHDRSFIDDPTRIFRGIRFEGRFGFAFAPDTMRQLREQTGGIADLTGPRIWHELLLYCAEPFPENDFSRIVQLGMAGQINGCLSWSDGLEKEFVRFRSFSMANWDGIEKSELAKADAEGLLWTWFSTCPANVIDDLGERLLLSGSTLRNVRGMAALRAGMPRLCGKKNSEITFFLDTIPMPSVICYARICSSETELSMIRSYVNEWRYVMPLSTGDDLLHMGYKAGPGIRDILTCLRAAWIDGEIRSSDEEIDRLEKNGLKEL